ncbi:MAG: porin family protein [Pseudomonadota bacterium]|nr:porin family protein [Pseudomonadota bacterium]
MNQELTPIQKQSNDRSSQHRMLLIVLTALLASPLLANAQSNIRPQPGLYLGGGIGYNRIESEEIPNSDDDLSDSQVAYKGIAGIRLGPILAIEGQYIDFGTAEDGDNRVDATGWTADAVVTLPLTERINPYGKIGALFWEVDARTFGVTPFSGSDDGTDMTYGVGVNFGITQSIAMRTEYERFELDDTSVDLGSANLTFSF